MDWQQLENNRNAQGRLGLIIVGVLVSILGGGGGYVSITEARKEAVDAKVQAKLAEKLLREHSTRVEKELRGLRGDVKELTERLHQQALMIERRLPKRRQRGRR